jgi:hypothetical protein
MVTLRRQIRAAVVAAIAVVFGCGRGDGVKLMLRYQPPAAATYPFSYEQHTHMKFEGGPMANMPEQQLTIRMYFTELVTGPIKGGIGVTVRFDSTTLDSPLMAANAYKPALERMRGVTSNVVYDNRMNMVHAEFTNVAGKLSPVTEQLGTSLKGMTFPLPQEPVGVGDSWTAETELPINQMASGGPPVSTTTKLTVKEIHTDGRDTTILAALETNFPRDPIKVEQQGQVLSLKLSGTMTGEYLFSVSRGAVVRSSRSGTMRIDMTGGMLGAGGANLTVKQTSSLQLREAQ